MGDYNLSTINSGTYQIIFSAAGYTPVTLTANLSNGVLTILDATLYPGSGVLGCTDSTASNYDPNANITDDSCVYSEEGYDCDGNCLDEDCAGECGGTAEFDECGVCGGSGPEFECEDGTLVCEELDWAYFPTV